MQSSQQTAAFQVVGAGYQNANGFYHRQKNTADLNDLTIEMLPPQVVEHLQNIPEQFIKEYWIKETGGCPWYQNSDGCIIYGQLDDTRLRRPGGWWLCDTRYAYELNYHDRIDKFQIYVALTNPGSVIPPAKGWEAQDR